MTTLAPWQTAWPALVLSVALVSALWGARRHVRVPAGDRAALGVFLCVAFAVRLWVVPALSVHSFDGHEAEYWDLFRGVRVPNRGGTVLYPSMQWLWWGLGRVLPVHPVVPVLLSASVGVAAAGLLGSAVGALTDRRVGWMAAILAALHPVQAAWSSSAYNVIIPHGLAVLALWAAATCVRSRRLPWALALAGAVAGGLAVLTRLDVAPMLLAPAGLLILVPAPGRTWRSSVRERAPIGVVLGLVGAVTAAGVWPLVYPGEVPGAGERALSFAVNVGLLSTLSPFDHVLPLLMVAVGGVLAARRFPRETLALVGAGVVHHLLMCAFDDHGDRHGLGVLPGILWALCVGGAQVGRAGIVVWALACGLSVWGLSDIRERFYGSEERFAALLDAPPYAELPRISVLDARTAPDGSACGWVAEDGRVAGDPVLSHFNLLQPDEAESLRGPTGCLRWCLDVQDWRWSSRGVRDRAWRVRRLYVLRPLAVVDHAASGYSCLALDVGPRTCCSDTPETELDGRPLRDTAQLP